MSFCSSTLRISKLEKIIQNTSEIKFLIEKKSLIPEKLFGWTEEKDRLKKKDMESDRQKENKKTWEYRRTRAIKKEKSHIDKQLGMAISDNIQMRLRKRKERDREK